MPNADGWRGRTVFYVADRATFVFTQSLQGVKGSDASNMYDEEVADGVFVLEDEI